eukprot:5693661-Prymnesium_polylepis.1
MECTLLPMPGLHIGCQYSVASSPRSPTACAYCASHLHVHIVRGISHGSAYCCHPCPALCATDMFSGATSMDACSKAATYACLLYTSPSPRDAHES